MSNKDRNCGESIVTSLVHLAIALVVTIAVTAGILSVLEKIDTALKKAIPGYTKVKIIAGMILNILIPLGLLVFVWTYLFLFLGL